MPTFDLGSPGSLDAIADELAKLAGRPGTIIITYDGKKASIDYVERDLASVIEEATSGEYIVSSARAFTDYEKHGSNYHVRIMINAGALKDAVEFAWGLFNILIGLDRLDATDVVKLFAVVFDKYLGVGRMWLELHEAFEYAWFKMIWGP